MNIFAWGSFILFMGAMWMRTYGYISEVSSIILTIPMCLAMAFVFGRGRQ